VGRLIEDREEIGVVKLYQQGHSVRAIAKQFKVSRQPISDILKKNQVSTLPRLNFWRRYGVDETYFDDINSPDKAYFLGWLYSDGCNALEQKMFAIGLQLSDFKILEVLRKYIKSERPIRLEPEHNKAMLLVNSKKLCERLNTLGCTPRKSLTLTWPSNIPADLLKYFVRGYFDGDGSAYIRRSGQVCVSVISSVAFSTALANYCQTTLNITLQQRRVGKVSSVGTGHSAKVLKFLCWLYSDLNKDLYLERKYMKFLEIKRLKECKL
jgi:hypothetical protein